MQNHTPHDQRMHGSAWNSGPLAPDLTAYATLNDAGNSASGEMGISELEALVALTDTALAHLSTEEVLRAALERVRTTLAVDNVMILLLDDAGTAWTVRAIHGLEEDLTIGVRLPVGPGVASQIARSRQPVVVDDVSQAHVVRPALRQRLRSLAGVPLMIGGQVTGVMHVGVTQTRRFTNAEVRLLQRVADRLALVLDHARLLQEAQAAREDAEQRAGELSVIFESLVDGVVVYDQDARVVRINSAQRALLGLDAHDDGEFLSLPFADRVARVEMQDASGRSVSETDTPQARILRGVELKGSNAEDIQIQTLDGRMLDVSVSGAPVRDRDGRITGAIILYRDVTERRQAQREREHMHSTVSHELRTPLTALTTRIQLLRRRMTRGWAVTDESLELLEHSSGQMRRLVDDLLESARLDTRIELSRQVTDLVVLCRQTAEDQTLATGRQISLDLPDTQVEICVDALRVGQILTNLLANAHKYSPAERPVSLRLRREANRACVQVQDAGPGIPAEMCERVFDKFYRAPGIQAQQGADTSLGLGLSICRRLVELHGGQIGVDSVVGQGATFWFTLPA